MTDIRMTETDIEIIVERAIDRLDARLMQSKITQAEYDYEVCIVDKWAEQQYQHNKAESV